MPPTGALLDFLSDCQLSPFRTFLHEMYLLLYTEFSRSSHAAPIYLNAEIC